MTESVDLGAIQNSEELAAARLNLLTAARHRLWIYLPILTVDSFSSAEELSELRRVAISGRGAEIRIVLHDPVTALRSGHRLIDLMQRLPSILQIRAPTDEQDRSIASAWVLNDSDGYLFLPDASRPVGRAALNDRSGQAPLLLQFEQTWQRAVPASFLQPLDL
jgi:hypothetical protein